MIGNVINVRPSVSHGVIGYYRSSDRLRYGWEKFDITDNADGSRVVHALCQIDAGPIRPRSVTRHVTYAVDGAGRPEDCAVRLERDGVFLGSGWFRFSDGFAECESFSPEHGRRSERVETTGRIPTFGAHNLTCDISHLRRFSHEVGQQVQRVIGALLASHEHDGCSAPELAFIDFAIEYVGREEVTVPAGIFEADHYRFLLEGALPEEHPTEDLWCIPSTYDFVKIEVGGYMDSTFELEFFDPGKESAIHAYTA